MTIPFPIQREVPWVVEFECSLEIIEELPRCGHPRRRGQSTYMGERIGERRVWEFLNDFQGTLKFNNPWHFPLDREGDCHLMTQVLECLIDITSPCLTRSELQKFNLCRLYLQVITLSDIATSSGTEIDIHFWKGNR